MGEDERTPSTTSGIDSSGIDRADIQQDSPAQAEAEVTDPDGKDTDETTGDVLQVAPIGQTGVVAGGTTVARP